MMSRPNGILAMNPEKYREIDGVVFDLESYARHCQPMEKTQPSAGPAAVFTADPTHAGWYEDPSEQHLPVPVMAGALPPAEGMEQNIQHGFRTVFLPAGSGSGSYTASYTTSYHTSFYSSGSGSYAFGSCLCLAGGYGLELI
ncbi:MAG: hypothetical protein ACOYIE_04850 [Agathobaculum sp.]|jgi:hypothetical protein|uniref:hypothetical protein n=1 Tax=Agathobaculum sp. TaxID=2048138 RepID=UPI003D8D4918